MNSASGLEMSAGRLSSATAATAQVAEHAQQGAREQQPLGRRSFRSIWLDDLHRDERSCYGGNPCRPAPHPKHSSGPAAPLCRRRCSPRSSGGPRRLPGRRRRPGCALAADRAARARCRHRGRGRPRPAARPARRRGAHARALRDREPAARGAAGRPRAHAAARAMRAPGALPDVEPAPIARGPGAARLHRQRDRDAARRAELGCSTRYGGLADLGAGILRAPPRGLVPRRPDPGAPRRPLCGTARSRAGAESLRLLRRGRPRDRQRRPHQRRAAADRRRARGRARLRLLEDWGLLDARGRASRAAAEAAEYLVTDPWSRLVDRAPLLATIATADGRLLRRPRGRSPISTRTRRLRSSTSSSPPQRPRARDRPGDGGDVARQHLSEWRRVELEIGGDDLIAAGVSEGPDVGRGLLAALHARLDGRIEAGREARSSAAASRPAASRDADPAGWANGMARQRRRPLPGRGSARGEGRVLDADRRRQRPPFDTLNLGLLTADESSDVLANRGRLGRALGFEPDRWRSAGRSTAPRSSHHTAPQDPSPFARGRRDAGGRRALDRASTIWRCSSSWPTACRSRSATSARWRCSTAAGGGSRAASWRAGPRRSAPPTRRAIGPGIGPCCFEVGEEVLDAFSGLGAGIADGRMLDLPEVAERLLARGRRRGRRAAGPLHVLQPRPVLLPPRPGARHGPPGRRRLGDGLMAGLIQRTRREPHRGEPRADRGRGRARASEVLVACKYVPLEEMGALAEAGVTLVGENRQQDLEAKQERWGEHSNGTSSATCRAARCRGCSARPADPLGQHRCACSSARAHGHRRTEVLVQVNVAGEEGKGGVARAELGAFIERCPVPVAGLSTMPPFTRGPGGFAAAFRPARRARGRARARAPVDGNEPGLAGRRRRGRDDHPGRHGDVPLNPARFSPRPGRPYTPRKEFATGGERGAKNGRKGHMAQGARLLRACRRP